MFRVLFVCTGNLYRSPLAAAFFSKQLSAYGRPDDWIVESAGTWTVPGQRVPARAQAAACAWDLDLAAHLTRPVDANLLAGFDLIVVMEKGHREALRIEFPFVQGKIRLLSVLADGVEYDIADPAEPNQEIEVTVSEISMLIERAYPRICRLRNQEEPQPAPTSHGNRIR